MKHFIKPEKAFNKIFIITLIIFVILVVFSSCELFQGLKTDIQEDIAQAKTEAYFRLYGLFEDTAIYGTIGNWNCSEIQLLGTKGYFLGLDSSGNMLVKGNYFYMEKPSSGVFYAAPDNDGTYTDDYQSPDDFDEGELWLNVVYVNSNGKWVLYTEDSRDGSFYMAKVDIPRGKDTFEEAVQKSKDDYDRRKADAHDYATHMLHYALEYYSSENKYKAYEDITKNWFYKAYPDTEIILSMNELEEMLPETSNADVSVDGKDIILTISGQRLKVQIYDYNGYDIDLVFTAKDDYAALASTKYFGLISYAVPHWNEKVWLRDNYPKFSALFDDVLKKATDIKMEERGGKAYFSAHYDMSAKIIKNLDTLEEKLDSLNPTITKAQDESGRLIVDFGSAKVKARVLKNLLKNTPDVEFTSVNSDEDAKVKTEGLWGLYEYSGNTYSPNIARNERLWLREQYSNLNSLIESIIAEDEI